MTGRATGVVIGTGLGTELGKIAQSVTQAETTKPPLVVRMEVFARQISLAVVGACILLGFVALWRGMPVSDVFFFAVALAVSAIPEGLPVAITVALSIAREIGIVPQSRTGREVVTGRELEEAGGPQSESFLGLVREARVFARVAPLQKLQIVEALRQMGHFVAVTGDGVNDAPALKRANIGVAMGSGSDVTKDNASLIVTDDNFASIEAGVEEGRFAYDKIRKVTYLLLSTGTAEVLLFLLALIVGVPLPLLPVQILWLNLVTNGIQHLALAFEGGEPGTMQRPPRRPEEGIFNRLMIRQTVVAGTTMGLLAFVNWLLLLDQDWSEAEARNRLLLLFVLMQNFHVFNCRSEYLSAFQVPIQRNYLLIFGVTGALGIHFLAMHLPIMQRVLSLSPVEWVEWLIPVVMASLLFVAMEIFKRIEHRAR